MRAQSRAVHSATRSRIDRGTDPVQLLESERRSGDVRAGRPGCPKSADRAVRARVAEFDQGRLTRPEPRDPPCPPCPRPASRPTPPLRICSRPAPWYQAIVARVFVSHASEDKVVVRRIAQALRAAGHDPWFDEEAILIGESIPAAVERGLRDSEFVLLCLSKAATARGWVEAEIDTTLMQQFRERKERVLPVRLEEVQPPRLIAQLAYADLFPGLPAFTAGIARVVQSIHGYQARREAPPHPR